MAKTTIHSDYIPDNAITSTKIAENSIGAREIATNAITTLYVADGSVTTVKIADDAITSAKLDTNIDIAGTFDVTGATTLDSTLSVSGDATISTAGSTVLLVEATGDNDSRVRIKSGTSNISYVEFADPGDADTGEIRYDHSTNSMQFRVNGNEEAITIDSSQRVGIGTASPNNQSKLTLNLPSGTNGRILTMGRSAGAYAYHLGVDANSRFILYNNDGTSALMAVDTSGNVGIGTDQPNQLLHLDNSTNTTDDAIIRIISGNAGLSGIYLGDPDYGSISRIRHDHSDNTLQFWSSNVAGTSSLQRMTIVPGGNVGIGITDPVARLDITGTTTEYPTVYDYLYATGEGIRVYGEESALDLVGKDAGSHASSILLRNENEGFGIVNNPTSNSLEFKSFDVTADDFSIHSSGTNVSNLTNILTLEKTGNVGIGTNNPAFASGSGLEIERAGIATLRFQNTSSGKSVEITQDSDFKIESMNSSSDILLMPTANVGIGTSSPSYKADIQNSGDNIIQTTGVISGGVTALNLRQSRGSLSSPTNSSTNGDGNYIVSQIYRASAYNPNAWIGLTTDSATDDGRIVFGTASSGTVAEKMRIGSDGKVYFGNQNNAASAGYIDKQTSGDYEFKIHASTSTTTDRAMTFHNRSNTEAMRIDSSGDVLIGQTSQTGYGFAQKLVVGDGDDNDGITIQSGPTHQGNLAFNHSDGTTAHGRISYQHNTNYMSFFTNNTERMRINSTGNVIFQKGTPIEAESGRVTSLSIGPTFVNALNFNTLGGTDASRGFYLVTAMRESASVGTSYVALIGVSTSSASYIYNVIYSNGFVGQMSGSWLQLKNPSGTVTSNVTAIPIGITGTD